MEASINETIEAFDARIHATFAAGEATKKLGKCGGNFAVIVHETAQWTVITKGPTKGIYRELRDDDMDFILITTPSVFAAMNKPAEDRTAEDMLDHAQIIADKKLAIHGDVLVYERFAAMAGAEETDALSLRGSDKPRRTTAGELKKKRTRKLV